MYQVVQQIDGQSSCLELLFRSSTEEGLTIHVGLLQRCGPLSGRALLALLDRLAVHVGAHQIELDDASFIVVGPVPAGDIWGECDIDYAIFTILATGESFYNQHGYQSEYDGAERARNAALIARPFGETLKSLYAREFAPLPPAQAAALPPSPREDQIAAVVMRDTSLPAYFCERNSALCHLDYTMSTKEIFGAIRASGILRTLKDCADPVAVWLDCVIHLFLPAVVYYGKRLVKTFAVSGGMGAATKRRRSNGRRRG